MEEKVLNLIINGIPSIPSSSFNVNKSPKDVLNLIINGIPSILFQHHNVKLVDDLSFKPYYKWNTFNTTTEFTGLFVSVRFKPYYKWNTFNTISGDMFC